VLLLLLLLVVVVLLLSVLLPTHLLLHQMHGYSENTLQLH
jgi:hypothetical protein